MQYGDSVVDANTETVFEFHPLRCALKEACINPVSDLTYNYFFVYTKFGIWFSHKHSSSFFLRFINHLWVLGPNYLDPVRNSKEEHSHLSLIFIPCRPLLAKFLKAGQIRAGQLN